MLWAPEQQRPHFPDGPCLDAQTLYKVVAESNISQELKQVFPDFLQFVTNNISALAKSVLDPNLELSYSYCVNAMSILTAQAPDIQHIMQADENLLELILEFPSRAEKTNSMIRGRFCKILEQLVLMSEDNYLCRIQNGRDFLDSLIRNVNYLSVYDFLVNLVSTRTYNVQDFFEKSDFTNIVLDALLNSESKHSIYLKLLDYLTRPLQRDSPLLSPLLDLKIIDTLINNALTTESIASAESAFDLIFSIHSQPHKYARAAINYINQFSTQLCGYIMSAKEFNPVVHSAITLLTSIIHDAFNPEEETEPQSEEKTLRRPVKLSDSADLFKLFPPTPPIKEKKPHLTTEQMNEQNKLKKLPPIPPSPNSEEDKPLSLLELSKKSIPSGKSQRTEKKIVENTVEVKFDMTDKNEPDSFDSIMCFKPKVNKLNRVMSDPLPHVDNGIPNLFTINDDEPDDVPRTPSQPDKAPPRCQFRFLTPPPEIKKARIAELTQSAPHPSANSLFKEYPNNKSSEPMSLLELAQSVPTINSFVNHRPISPSLSGEIKIITSDLDSPTPPPYAVYNDEANKPDNIEIGEEIPKLENMVEEAITEEDEFSSPLCGPTNKISKRRSLSYSNFEKPNEMHQIHTFNSMQTIPPSLTNSCSCPFDLYNGLLSIDEEPELSDNMELEQISPPVYAEEEIYEEEEETKYTEICIELEPVLDCLCFLIDKFFERKNVTFLHNAVLNMMQVLFECSTLLGDAIEKTHLAEKIMDLTSHRNEIVASYWGHLHKMAGFVTYSKDQLSEDVQQKWNHYVETVFEPVDEKLSTNYGGEQPEQFLVE